MNPPTLLPTARTSLARAFRRPTATSLPPGARHHEDGTLSSSPSPFPRPALKPPCSSTHCRPISTSSARRSGHSRWATIKHDKAKNDAKLSKQRSYLSQEIVAAVRAGGPDATTNARLASLIAETKKANFPKAMLERSIARGEGRSASGAPLESMSLEFMFPPAVGGIVEAETDSRTRTMQEIKSLLRKHGASASPSAFLFDRRGRVAWLATPAVTEEAVLEEAIEAGALDVESRELHEEEHGVAGREIVVWTEVTDVASVATELAKSLGSQPRSQELVWKPKEDTMVHGFENETFDTLMSKLDEIQEIQEIYLNTA